MPAGRATVIPALFINGKFAAQRTTGVQRVAAHHVLALDALLDEAALGQASAADRALLEPLGTVILLCPPQARQLPLRRVQVRAVGPRGLPLHLWEQAVLPWAARRGRLLSLAGSAPWWARAPAATLHDAALWDHPEAYTTLFGHWYRALFRRQARVANPLLTVSAFSQQRLAACLGVPVSRLAVVHNGSDHLDPVQADDSVLTRHGLQPGTYLLAVAHANPTKNLDALLRAYALWPHARRPSLVIVGGQNSKVFSPGPAGTDPAGAIRLGIVDDAQLKALYQHALGLVFPSVYEGFGLPPLEAMRVGCPVIVARAASLPEVCGEAALYFDPQDEGGLLQAMLGLASEPALRRRLQTLGPVHAANFTWRAAAWSLVRALTGPAPSPSQATAAAAA